MKKSLIFIALLGLSMLALPQRVAAEKIVWPYVCFSPLFICEDGHLTGGYGHEILKKVWEGMPEDDHTLVMMPIKRILAFAQKKEHQLFYGLYKTPKRESFLYFSLPCRISVPPFLVIRKQTLSRTGLKKSVFLEQILKDRSKTFLRFNAISFGTRIDKILDRFEGVPNVIVEYNTTEMIDKSLRLLLNNRVDYFLSLDGTVETASRMGVIDQLAFLHIQEKNRYEVGYITAPKTPWGKKKIEQVNRILSREIPKPYFFNLFTPLVADDLIPELKAQFNEVILAPAQGHIALSKDIND